MSNKIGEKIFTFTWKIENFSLCAQKNGEYISSPTFTAECIEGSKWNLRLYPRGKIRQFEDYVSCFMGNKYLNSKTINLKYEIEIISADQEVLGYGCKERLCIERKAFGWLNLLQREKIDSKIKTSSDDILTVCCRMVKIEPERNLISRCGATTTVGADRLFFQWLVKKPCSPDWFQCKTVIFKSLQIELILTAPEHDVLIAIIISRMEETLRFVNCNITVLNPLFRNQYCKSDSCFYHSQKLFWRFPSFFTRSLLENKEATSLEENDHFNLICQFSISNGTLSKGVAEYDIDTCSSDPSPSVHTDNLSTLQNDLLGLYISKKLTDVKLKKDTDIFLVHKSILSARSPVFLSMFDMQMTENETTVVDVSDMDFDTLNSFLKFIYTGTVDKMNNKSASKLLIAAEKYQVWSLKEKCFAFLKAIISKENVQEILIIAHDFQNETLKGLAIDHIKNRLKFCYI